VNQWDYLGLYDTIDEAGLAGALAAAAKSLNFHNRSNPNWTTKYYDRYYDFKLEYAGLVCCKDKVYEHTPPHPGVIYGPYPKEVKKPLLINGLPAVQPKGKTYDTETGKELPDEIDPHTYSEPQFDHGTKKAVSCELVFGVGWEMVGHFHSHPWGSGTGPSKTDLENTLPGKRYLGVVGEGGDLSAKPY
jgi:proteasome lid subunit RPN8/RPN11